MMYDCLEILDEITEIYPIPSGVVTFPVPFQVRHTIVEPKYSIEEVQYDVTLDWLRTQRGMVVESVASENHHAGSLLIEFKPSVKSSQKSGIAGRYFQISIQAKSHQDLVETQDFVNYVDDSETFDTFIVDASENIYVVRGVYPATNIEMSANLPRYKEHDITLSIECVNGIQQMS